MRLTDNAQKEKQIMSTTNTLAYPCSYIQRSLADVPAKIEAGTLQQYEYYGWDSNQQETILNGHVLRMRWELRINVAARNDETQAWELLAVPDAYVTVTMILMPSMNDNGDVVTLSKRYNIAFETEGYQERVDEAIMRYNQVVNAMTLPAVSFDFWKYVSTAAPAFQKAASLLATTSWATIKE